MKVDTSYYDATGAEERMAYLDKLDADQDMGELARQVLAHGRAVSSLTAGRLAAAILRAHARAESAPAERIAATIAANKVLTPFTADNTDRLLSFEEAE